MMISGWDTQTLGEGGGGDSSLALDEDSFGQISYYGDWPDYPFLNYASQDIDGWNFEQLADIGIAEWDSFTSLTLDRKGDPHISYYVGIDYWRNILKYTHKQDGEWQIHTVDSHHGGNNSIAFDVFDRLHISYHDPVNQDLRYAVSPAPSHQVILRPSMNWGYALPGSTIIHTLEIINGGQQTDTYEVIASDNLWLAEIDMQVGPISFQECTKLDIQVTVPPTATLGNSDAATITLTLQGDPSVTASATLTTYAALTTYLPLIAR